MQPQKLTLEIHKKVRDPKAIKKARLMLGQLAAGEICARKTNKFKYRVIEVHRDIRLLDRIPGVLELLTHESYNKLVDKRRKLNAGSVPRGW